MRLTVRGGSIAVAPEDGLPYLRGAAGLVERPGAVTVEDGVIVALDDDPAADIVLDARGGTVVPGLVDCHTHLPFAGWRHGEYAMKVAGARYEDIARAGGGIRSSARALAAAPDEAVLAQAQGLAAEMLAHGTTTLETKSGYGLSVEQETRALRLAGALGERVAQEVVRTALVAHAVPEGTSADEWLDTILAADLGGAESVDIYVESVAFTNGHLARLGDFAAANGLRLRAHVEQFACHRSVPVALEAGARSVDHLACLHADDLAPLAASETAAVLLPGAEFLGDEQVAPGRALADAGAICVLGTDANPGTSPVVSLPLIIGLAVRRYRWTALEALAACTLNAAYVLDRHATTGSIEVGKRADLVVLDGPVDAVPYRFGHNPVRHVIAGGEVVCSAS